MTSSAQVFDSYLSWLKENTVTHAVDDSGFAEISTPFLNHLRDSISIFVKFDETSNIYSLTDGGNTLAELSLAGVEIGTPKRKEILKGILHRYGVQLEGTEINVKASISSLASKKHDLLQAILGSEELINFSRASIASVFWEDVASFLDQLQIRFVTDIKLTGTSGFNHHFNFVIPKSSNASQRILQAVSTPTKDRVEQILWAWQDTKIARKEDSELIVFLNDQSRIDYRLSESLTNYEATPILWSERESYARVLQA